MDPESLRLTSAVLTCDRDAREPLCVSVFVRDVTINREPVENRLCYVTIQIG